MIIQGRLRSVSARILRRNGWSAMGSGTSTSETAACAIKMNATAYAPPIGQRKRNERRTGRGAFSGRAATISTSPDCLDRSGGATNSHTALELEVNKGLFNLLSKEDGQT